MKNIESQVIIPNSSYPGFKYSSDELLKFLAAGGIFTIKLINDEIIHHEVKDPLLFKQWLLDNNIEDIKQYKTPERV